MERISKCNVPDGHQVFSVGVESLFTNISHDLVLDAVKNKLNQIEVHTKLPSEFFAKILKFCLEITYCVLKDKYYKKI